MDGGTGGLDEGGEVPVQVADAAEAAEGFLAEVAAFMVVDGGAVEAGFWGEQAGDEFMAPSGDGVQDF